MASYRGHEEIIHLLLAHGADKRYYYSIDNKFEAGNVCKFTYNKGGSYHSRSVSKDFLFTPKPCLRNSRSISRSLQLSS